MVDQNQFFKASINMMFQETSGLVDFMVRFESSSINRSSVAYPQGVSIYQSKNGGGYIFGYQHSDVKKSLKIPLFFNSFGCLTSSKNVQSWFI